MDVLKYVNVDLTKVPMKRVEKAFDHFDDVAFMRPPKLFSLIKKIPPLKPQTDVLERGSVSGRGYRPLVCDLVYDRDVPIVLRDGIRVYADIFRPVDDSQTYPVVLAWTPYGKIDPPVDYEVFPDRANMRKELSCGLDTFEGPEPDYWVENEYIVAVVDSRGSTNSEGDFLTMGHEEAKDIYDTIEWLGTQPWSNGNVGMVGNSWLAISQYFVAAEKPPHLAAIAPWEGFSDLYRDQVCWGGIPAMNFANRLGMYLRPRPGANCEDFGTMLARHPQINDYWAKEKRPNFDNIEVPMYAVASWTSNLHPYGTFRAWKMAASKQKWLRVHNTQEWIDFQTPKYRDELRDFFDHFLKGEDNCWTSTPRVRVSLLDPSGPDLVDQAIEDFPVPDTRYDRLFLDARNGTLVPVAPTPCSASIYRSSDNKGQAQFKITFDKDVTLCGYITARFFVSVDKGDDMDLFAYVNKEDSIGVAEHPRVLGVDFMGAEGRLRVSHRTVTDGTLWDYKYDWTVRQPLEPNDVVQVDLVLWPLGMTWRKGEKLVLTLAGYNLQNIEFPAPPISTINQGCHSIHAGGDYASYIDIPVV